MICEGTQHICQQKWVLLEIISKAILSYRDLKTTQVYLGEISDAEAIRWMVIPYFVKKDRKTSPIDRAVGLMNSSR